MQGACPLRHPIGCGPQGKQRACPIRTLSVEKQGDVPLAVQGGSGGIPRPFEGGIGGPGGHRGEVGIPPAPLAGGATLQKKNHLAKPRKNSCFLKTHASWVVKSPSSTQVIQNTSFPHDYKRGCFLPETAPSLLKKGVLFHVDMIKNETVAPLTCKNFIKHGAEGFQRATGKPFGRARRRESLCTSKKTMHDSQKRWSKALCQRFEGCLLTKTALTPCFCLIHA